MEVMTTTPARDRFFILALSCPPWLLRPTPGARLFAKSDGERDFLACRTLPTGASMEDVNEARNCARDCTAVHKGLSRMDYFLAEPKAFPKNREALR